MPPTSPRKQERRKVDDYQENSAYKKGKRFVRPPFLFFT
jgi:hypothetical protein